MRWMEGGILGCRLTDHHTAVAVADEHHAANPAGAQHAQRGRHTLGVSLQITKQCG